MSVVVISRLAGSCGGQVAETVARALGWHLADETTLTNILNEEGSLDAKGPYDATTAFWTRLTDRTQRMRSLVDDTTKALAQHGDVVILGGGAFAPLQGYTDVLKVRLQAPFPIRVKRIMKQRGITEEQSARKALEAEDAQRMAYVESTYGVRMDVADLFDMVLNVAVVPPEIASGWIVEAARGLRKGQVPYTAQLAIESISPATIAKHLGCDVRNH